MKLLFVLLSLPETNIGITNGLYIDLAKECKALGHDVTIIGSSLKKTRLSAEDGITVLRVKARKIVGESNLVKKGIAMAILPFLYKLAYNKYIDSSKFDWIIMPTPPITLIDFVAYVKRRLGSRVYLILRDIHPQSSWSLGEIKYKWMYDYLDRRSRKGYSLADLIGCMSNGNISYILKEYPKVDKDKMVILYNWIQDYNFKNDTGGEDIRSKYKLDGKIIALFGGNIALGQRIENLIDLAEHYRYESKYAFVVIGKGVKKRELEEEIKLRGLKNVSFFDFMPQKDYLQFVRTTDIGLISINENNAAPTCPSKLASYMSMKIPVLAMINRNNDYGNMIDEANAGYWAVGSEKQKIYKYFEKLASNADLRKRMGEDGYNFFKKYMTTHIAADTMITQMYNYNG